LRAHQPEKPFGFLQNAVGAIPSRTLRQYGDE
jgi:hypothetical protein